MATLTEPYSEVKCAFFVKRKGRSCRMLATKGSLYCPEHLMSDGKKEDESMDKRILCPLDPSHTIYEKNIDKHLKKCNAGKREVPCCYVSHINTGIVDYKPLKEEMYKISDFNDDAITNLIGRINDALSLTDEPILWDVLEHKVFRDEIINNSNGTTALKHLLQQSSIIGHLEKLKLLGSDSLFIEFGAGRGKLSHWIQLVLSDDQSNDYLLIDRSNPKRKFDMYHRFDSQGPKFKRLIIDIEHLDLSLYDSINDHKHIIGISKHLCGSGTDVTLRCLTRYSSHCTPLASPPPSLPVIIIALCCHHSCEWSHIFGREIWEELGFNSIDFHLISLMSSWGVCGERSSSHGYVPHHKEHIGIKCKKLIDVIRIRQLRKHGYQCRLVYYVDRKTSLENVLLIAVP